MSMSIEIEIAERSGRPVVVKRATDDAGCRRLDREAQRLRAARHPGVVELLDREPAALTFAWAGDQSLETHRPGLGPAAAILTAVAETVADLCDLGIVHGRLSADHVIIDGRGRPRLGGLSGAEPDADPPTPADDVAAVGHLIDLLVGGGAEAEPIPEHRWRRRPWTGYQRRTLQTLADQATDPDPAHRPSARELAAALAEAMPDARLDPPTETASPTAPAAVPSVASAPGRDPEPVADIDAGGELDPETDDELDDRLDDEFVAVATFLGMRVGEDATHPGADRHDGADGPPRRAATPTGVVGSPSTASRRLGHPVAAAVLLLVLAAGAVFLADRPSRSAAPLDASAPAEVAVSPIDEAPMSPPSAATPTSISSPPTGPPLATPSSSPGNPSATCPPVAAPSADVDGDGCAEAIGVTGSSIQAGAVRYRLGNDGDDVAVGDWDCDGSATPALVRPSTGEVFVFSRWATSSEPLSLRATAVVPGAAAPVAADGCGPLRVRTTEGTVTTIRMSGS